VPRLTITWQMSSEESALFELTGSKAKARIVRHVAQHGPISTADVAAAIGVHHVTAAKHLAELDAAGVVRASHDAGSRVGRAITWAVDEAGIQHIADRWRDYLAGR